MKFSVLALLAATAAVVTAAPSGERRAIEFGSAKELDERWFTPAYAGTEDPSAKRSLDERGFRPSYVSTEDPSAKRSLAARGFRPSWIAAEDPSAKRSLDERGFRVSYVSTEDPAAKRSPTKPNDSKSSTPDQSRPRTAVASAGLEQEDSVWNSEDDEDEGMFSFARPSTGQQHTATSAPAPPFSQFPASPLSTDGHLASNSFSFAIPPSFAPPNFPSNEAQQSTMPPSASPAAGYNLTPAAAYALENNSSDSGPRKRTSFSAPESPSYTVGNPYERHLKREEREEEDLQRRSFRSSRDKIESLDATWADEPNLSYALTPDGQAIMLNEMGQPIRLATSREQKILADLGVGDFVPYQVEPDYEEEEDSPYPEVRASVSNIDDPEMPVLTFRVWLMGTFFCVVISAVNTFFNLRYPAPIITPILVQIISYPFGKFLARFLPISDWNPPRWARKIGFPAQFSLNPGPFNIKEHTLLVIMSNISTYPAYGITFSLTADKYYRLPFSSGFDVLLLITTQVIGFGAAGLCRKYLVWPAAMIWPQNLVFCTLLNTLHAEDEDEGQGISRFKFFTCTFCLAFAWYWLPGFLFTALSAFSWVCWIAPNNVVNQLFGVSSGLGMGLLTFDWSQIAYIGSPLVVPWWAEVNVFCGFAVAFWIVAPIMYYSNVWNSAYLPMSTSQVFDRFGAPYNTSVVVDPIKFSLNETAYREYSPLYLPITYATVYGISFMLSTSVIVHTVLYHGKSLIRQFRQVQVEDQDVHMKLMKNYPEVPNWWYMILLTIAFGLSIATVAAFDTQMPVWSLILAIVLGLIYMIPAGFVFALTSTSVSINLIGELIAGYAIPGLPLANMLFKVYATQTLATGLSFVQDLKIGHYMKIPPRATFSVQVASTILAALVQSGVKKWLLSAVPDLCSRDQAAQLTCPTVRVFGSSSVFWGLIGPARQFGPLQLYNPILYWLLAGAVLPFLTWALAKRFPKTFLAYVNVPVALAGATYMPPATGINFSSWFFVGFIFQYLLRRRQFRWWSKFNFVLSAGLDSGTVLSGLLIFLTLFLPKHGSISLNWWGNDVYTKTLDWAGVSYKTPPPEGFGGTSW
ncbi:uncharacterized protein JCM6883_005386 [Sporobolomyces salmoneus]|uniref:uncharacterized protein n=1 Tax=Sporobolomyces salmoneus TaxID=183962 RepID=UPI0031769EA0